MKDAKIGVIFGHDDKNGEYSEGKFLFYGNVYDDEVFHAQCLLDFANVYFPDNNIFKKLNVRHSPSTIGMFYVFDGNVLLLNTSSDKHGKSVTIMMPEDMSLKVIDKLYKVVSELDNFSLTLIYDIYLNDGIINGNEMSTYTPEDRMNLLDKYFDMKNTKNNKK